MNEPGLTLYENAKQAVMELLSVDEVRGALDRTAAVQEYARRAKDRDLEMRAAEYRVYCERRLGEFSAAAVRPTRGGDHSAGSTESSRSDVARTVGVSDSTLIRKHEPLAAAPTSEFERAVEQCKTDNQPPTATRVLNTLNSTKSVGNEGADQWNTPGEIISIVLAIWGVIDLDPCADAAQRVLASRHYTLADDGLSQPWAGRVYMNPPYSEALAWTRKLFEEYEGGRCDEAIVLLPARPGSAWFRRYRDCPMCLITGRLTFAGARAAAPFPSVLFYLGDDPTQFNRYVDQLGDVFVRVRR